MGTATATPTATPTATGVPPFNGMVKDTNPDTPEIESTANLWICEPGTGACTVGEQGKNSLDIYERLYLNPDIDSPNDADTDPEGLGAYEFQIRYDEKVFEHPIQVVDQGFANGAFGNRLPSWNGFDACAITVMTENWILFGCGSKDNPATPGFDPGKVSFSGDIITKITVKPQPDLRYRIRPTKDNGVVRTLVDDNCNVSDVYANNGEGAPWPGTLPGGITPDCTNATITVRMLEGDLNLDCQVDIQDDQAIAYRYGSTFGMLTYDSFHDLDPSTGDNDIDIKDLQFVFGRNGSRCQAPIPDQPPSPPIP
jgi:hypothetical protein